MHSVLICSAPVHGHVAPLASVARGLVSRGLRVRFLTGGRYRDEVEATGATWVGLPPAADFDDTAVDREFPDRLSRNGLGRLRYDMTEIFLRPVPAQFTAVEQQLRAEPTDAILAESTFFGAAAFVGRPRGERPLLVNLGIVPLGLTSRYTAPFGLARPPMAGLPGRIRNAFLRLLSERVVFGSVQREAQRIFRKVVGQPLPGFFLDWPLWTDAVMQFTVRGFEYPRPDRDAMVRFVGPVSRSEAAIDLPDWWDDLSSGRPVVLVTQGTVANLDPSSLIGPTIAGLAEQDVLVVVTTGGRELPELDRARPANVRVATYLPYDHLLPRTDVMVSNGGYGGIHFALRYGVPLVVAGTTEDKAEVNARVAWSGAGINLRTDRPSATAVATAVRRVLTEPDFRAASERIGKEIAAAPGVDGVADYLEATLTTP